MKTALAFLLCAGTLAATARPPAVFEQSVTNPNAWRATGAGTDMLVFPEGFALRSGDRVLQFRWDRALQLSSVEPERIVPSTSYALAGANGRARELHHAERIRAFSKITGLSILYYFGSRGLEFDIEAAPGVTPPTLRLESEDADFTKDGLGHLSVEGRSFALAPIAYSEDSEGQRSRVAARYLLTSPRVVTFEIGPHRSDRPLVIDPVVVYATYFGGSGDETPLALREMADGTVLIAGNTKSIDLPMSLSLGSTSMIVPRSNFSRQCFVARLSTADKQYRFVSYFGGGGSVTCTSVDLDSSGRILLTGYAAGTSLLATANAERVSARFPAENFLARIASDGRSVEYATYLNLDANVGFTALKAGPAETAYITVSCSNSFSTCAPDAPSFAGAYQTTADSTALLRYDIAARRYDQKTYLSGFADLSGIDLSPAGGVYVYGNTRSTTIPLKNAFQTAPPTARMSAGAIVAISPDFRTLLFGSYLGGQNARTNLTDFVAASDGSVWLAGLSDTGAIPDLQAVKPNDGQDPSPFAVQVVPGAPNLSKAFTARGYGLNTIVRPHGVLFPGGPFCLATIGASTAVSAGGAVTGTGTNLGLLGCLNDEGNDFQMVTAIGSFAQFEPILATPSTSGGVWSLQLKGRGGFGDVIPYALKANAIQPFPGVTSGPDSDDLVLRYVDLKFSNPVLTTPQQVSMLALQGNTISSVTLAGRNFAAGMQLKIGSSTTLPLAVSNSETASASYSPTTFLLPAGSYLGQLVIPTRPQPLSSDFFQVTVGNLVPALQPFTVTSNPRTFNVIQPVYRDSQVLWNGSAIPYSGGTQVQIPTDLALPGAGELTLVNPRPGGGVQRQTVTIGATASTIPTAADPVAKRIPAETFQVDRSRKLLYVVVSESTQWTLASYSLPEGTPLQSTAIPKDSATMVVEFRLSTDGSFLYFTDDRLRVLGFRASTLAQDFQFQIPRDAPPGSSSNTSETRHKLRTLADSPQAVLIVTPAGRMILYDRDQPRPYTSAEFPSASIDTPVPVLATAEYVYSVRAPDIYLPVPCVSRHPIDAYGFGPPEDICNIGNNWGKYPEMKRTERALFLESQSECVELLINPDGFGNVLSPVTYDNSRNLGIVTNTLSFDFNTRAATYRLVFSSLDKGSAIGHYPARTPLRGPDFNTPPNFVPVYANNVVIVDDETMVYLERSGGIRNQVTIVPSWQKDLERYPQ